MIGGRNRARTCDPLIKSQLFSIRVPALSQKKTVKPASNDQWLSPDLSNRSRRRSTTISPAGAVIVVLACLNLCAVAQCAGADLPFDYRPYGRWERPQAFTPVRPARAAPTEGNAGVTPRPPTPVVAAPPTRPPPPRVYSLAPQQPMYEARKEHKAPPAGPSTGPISALASTVLSAVADLARIGFGFLLGLLVLNNIKSIAHFIDGLFEANSEEASAGMPANNLKSNPLSDALHDLSDVAQTELSAADIRKQTEILRTLKDQLDAEAEAARADIRRERAWSKQQQPQEYTP